MPRPTDPAAAGTLDPVVGRWLASLNSANTRAAYSADLRRFLAWCASERLEPLALDRRGLRRYRAALERSGASSSTTARRLSALASFGAFAGARALTDGLADVARPTVAPARAVVALDDREADALLSAADGMTARSAVLVRLLMLDGLKVGEAAGADAADVSGRPPSMTLVIGDRSVRLHADTADALHAYLARRRSGPLLLSEGRARRSDRLTRFGVDYLVKEVAESAGLRRSISGNTLRRRYVVAAHADGVELDAIRSGVGHADVRTTRRYLPVGRSRGTGSR